MSAQEQTRTESLSSVKISTTAAGKALPEVKVYADSNDPDAVWEAQRLAVEMYAKTLRETA